MEERQDTISRQAAIDALMPIYKSASLRNRNVFSTARKCMAVIEELPSAEQKKGRWILTRNMWCCSECASIAPYYYMSGRQKTSNYCYVCGAKMENIDQQG